MTEYLVNQSERTKTIIWFSVFCTMSIVHVHVHVLYYLSPDIYQVTEGHKVIPCTCYF